MVYHEIAVEPTAIEDFKDLSLLERQFGFDVGRLISFMPAKPKEIRCWKTLFYEHLKTNLPPEKHKDLELRVIAFLERAIYRSRNRSALDDGQSWCDLALQEDAIKHFSAILCEGPSSNSAILPFQGLHDPDETFPDFLFKPIHFADSMKDPEVFLESLRPLISSAKRLHIIDPHFDPAHPEEPNRRRWQATVRKLSEFLRDANRLTIDIHFNTQADRTRNPKEFVTDIGSRIVGLFPPSTKLFVSAWSKKHQSINWHARYLLTDKAGVALDYGFDMGKDRRTDVTLLPRDKACEKLAEFNPETPTIFTLEATIQRTGTRAAGFDVG
jgi:hypothetical protein